MRRTYAWDGEGSRENSAASFEQRLAGFSWLLLVPLTPCDFRTSKDAFTESWPQVHSDITQFHQAVPGVHSVYLLSRQGLIQLDRCVAEKK